MDVQDTEDAPRTSRSAQGGSETPAEPAEAAPGGAVDTAPPMAAAAGTDRTSKVGAYVVAGCIAALLALTVLGGLLNVGDHLGAVHPALGWAFYALLAALVVAGVVAPTVRIVRRPVFSLYQLRDERGHAKRRRCRMLVDNLISTGDLTDEEAVRLQQCLQAGDQADDQLIAFFHEHCVPRIDEATKKSATAAFFVSAVAHSPLVNMATMLSICLDLVRSIVETCGFRPTNFALGRLYARVMVSALIVGGIEDSDLGDLVGQLMGGGAGARAGGLIVGATAEGVVSAFLTFRVGVITKKWLTAEDGPARMATIRRTSYREALALMRTSGFMQTVAESMKQATSTVASSVASSVADTAKQTVAAARSALPFSPFRRA